MNLNKWLSDNKITEVECLVSDIAGIPRGKIVPVEKYIKTSSSEGLRLPEYVFGQNVTGDYGDSNVLGETVGDVVLKPDAKTVRLVPWYKEPTAQIIHDAFYFDGRTVDVSPREVLKNVLKFFNKEGLKPVVAPELEFFLVEQNSNSDDPLRTPLGRSGLPEKAKQAYGIDAVNDFDPLFEDIYDFCDTQKIDIDTLSHEAGAAQMEINFNHGEATELADQVFLFKRTVRQTAISHNLHATFMAKPMQYQPGSAMHIHVSVFDEKTGKNIFSNKEGSETDQFYYALAGLQNHFSGAMALERGGHRMTGHEWSERMTVGERLAIIFCQYRLWIEGINLRESAIEKNMDDAFSAGTHMQWCGDRVGKHTIPSKQARQGNHAESHSASR